MTCAPRGTKAAAATKSKVKKKDKILYPSFSLGTKRDRTLQAARKLVWKDCKDEYNKTNLYPTARAGSASTPRAPPRQDGGRRLEDDYDDEDDDHVDVDSDELERRRTQNRGVTIRQNAPPRPRNDPPPQEVQVFPAPPQVFPPDDPNGKGRQRRAATSPPHGNGKQPLPPTYAAA